jgi:hypothetical protein
MNKQLIIMLKLITKNDYLYPGDKNINNLETIDNFTKHLNFNPHKRFEISLITNDLKKISELKYKGWIKKQTPEGIKLKAPEVWLVDLTDPFKHDLFKSTKLVFDFYNFLIQQINTGSINNLIKSILDENQIKELEFKLVNGKSISYEIRVIGSDKRVYLLRELLLEYFLVNSNKQYIVDKNLCLENKDQKLFFEKLINTYQKENICENKKLQNIEIKNLTLPFENYDYVVLIPTSCFKYTGLLKNINCKKIVLIRTHASNNFLIEDTINFPSNLNNKKCLVMDISYSGETLKFMKSYLSNLGAKVETLALFPKSQLAIKNSDYCIILNEFCSSKELLNLSIEKIYEKIGVIKCILKKKSNLK